MQAAIAALQGRSGVGDGALGGLQGCRQTWSASTPSRVWQRLLSGGMAPTHAGMPNKPCHALEACTTPQPDCRAWTRLPALSLIPCPPSISSAGGACGDSQAFIAAVRREAERHVPKQEPGEAAGAKREPATAQDAGPAAADRVDSAAVELLTELEEHVVVFLRGAAAAKPARKTGPKPAISPTRPGPSPSRLPACILANKEPYRQGEWRREPYPARDYQTLTEYTVSEPQCEAGIRRKLRTSKTGGCDGVHCTSLQGLGSYRWCTWLGSMCGIRGPSWLQRGAPAVHEPSCP